MIEVPAWALLILLAFGIVATVHAELQRRKHKQLQEQLTAALARIGEAKLQAHNDALIEGLRRGFAEALLAAMKAQRRNLDPIAAIRQAGALNAPALLKEPNGEVVTL